MEVSPDESAAGPIAVRLKGSAPGVAGRELWLSFLLL
jgi:hypothetical protein